MTKNDFSQNDPKGCGFSLPVLERHLLSHEAHLHNLVQLEKIAGTEIDILFVKKPANEVILAHLNEFKALTGITASPEWMPEQQHRQKLVIEFGSGRPTFDVTELSLKFRSGSQARESGSPT